MTTMVKMMMTVAMAAGVTMSAGAADVTVTLEGNDKMQFNKKAFEVTSGDNVTLIFKNVGTLPKVAMGHNVVILKAGVAYAPFATAAISAAAHDYIPQDQKDKILAMSKLLGPGEVDTITFTAPAAGSYNFVCTFPGHFALMNGVMTVK